jgi:hypothetical protein
MRSSHWRDEHMRAVEIEEDEDLLIPDIVEECWKQCAVRYSEEKEAMTFYLVLPNKGPIPAFYTVEGLERELNHESEL